MDYLEGESEQISLRLPIWLLEQLQKRAAAEQRSRAALIRRELISAVSGNSKHSKVAA